MQFLFIFKQPRVLTVSRSRGVMDRHSDRQTDKQSDVAATTGRTASSCELTRAWQINAQTKGNGDNENKSIAYSRGGEPFSEPFSDRVQIFKI